MPSAPTALTSPVVWLKVAGLFGLDGLYLIPRVLARLPARHFILAGPPSSIESRTPPLATFDFGSWARTKR